MPAFHTKTIESILDPVAQQVSKLIILHEEAEDGNAMPDLQKPVEVVKQAVLNLVKVGWETIDSSNDHILKQDMPPSLHRVEEAAVDLQQAADLIRQDAYSVVARKKLIDGSRGILQGTSSLLLTFDLSEVRKIIRQCKNVLDVLAITEVVDTMEHLVEFVKSLSPCLSRMTQEVDAREKELTHQAHREMLQRSLEKIKSLTPVLISSMKMFITTRDHNGAGLSESQENRDYVVVSMSNEIQEIIRVLQLTTSEDNEWYDDDLAVMHACKTTMENRLATGRDWLNNPQGLLGSAGEKSLRQLTEEARKIAALSGDQAEGANIERLANEVDRLVDALAEYRLKGQGNSPQAQALVQTCQTHLAQLMGACDEAVSGAERHGVFRPARTIEGKVAQAQRWLANPASGPQRQTGVEACRALVQEGRRLVETAPDYMSQEDNAWLARLCSEVETRTERLDQLAQRNQAQSSEAQELSLALSQSLTRLRDQLQHGLVDQVGEHFLDVQGPLRHLQEAANQPVHVQGRKENYEDTARAFQDHADRLCRTAELVAANCADQQPAESVRSVSSEVSGMTGQVVHAGRLVLQSGGANEGPVSEHFDLLRKQWIEGVEKMRSWVDEATDTESFIMAQEQGILRDTELTMLRAGQKSTTGVVEHTSNIARRANRVLQVAKQEADNSEDPKFVDRMDNAVQQLRATMTPMVMDAKGLVSNLNDPASMERWQNSNQSLISAVGGVRQAVTTSARSLRSQSSRSSTGPVSPPPPVQMRAEPPVQEMAHMVLSEQRRSSGSMASRRSGTPETETDVEEEFDFPVAQENQPILAAAHALHQEAQQWSSRDNEIIAAAKKMAALMAKLSQVVRGESGTKKDLIDIAKAIAEASENVTRCAKQLAKECTDKRMRTSLLQVCERIPTIGTQLKILSTVKAAMLGTQGSDEDQEATEMLVGNAQNLMQSVEETIHCAQAASIKIRVDSGLRIRWDRRKLWYQQV